jgi:predicted membrane protein
MIRRMDEQRRDLRLFFRLNVFYGLLFGISWLAHVLIPDISSHLPIGTIDRLMNYGDTDSFAGVEIHASRVVNELDSLIWLITAVFGAVLLMVPVSWTYISIREKTQMDQSLLQSMIVLPIAVTGIVLVVHNSLALAFSLTGVVAAVRYRTTLKSTADSLFIFMAVAVGLAAGIGMLIIGAVMTVIFCYTFLLLWKLNYGFRKEAKQYMRSAQLDSQEGDDLENDHTG